MRASCGRRIPIASSVSGPNMWVGCLLYSGGAKFDYRLTVRSSMEMFASSIDTPYTNMSQCCLSRLFVPLLFPPSHSQKPPTKKFENGPRQSVVGSIWSRQGYVCRRIYQGVRRNQLDCNHRNYITLWVFWIGMCSYQLWIWSWNHMWLWLSVWFNSKSTQTPTNWRPLFHVQGKLERFEIPIPLWMCRRRFFEQRVEALL